MKKRFALALAIGLCLYAAAAAPARAQSDVFGYYTIANAPRAFADISEIHLAGDYGATLRPPVYGLIRMKARRAKDFPILKPVMSGRNISFSTKAVGGVTYRFTGSFVKLDNFPANPPEGVILQGKLVKLKGKVKIAEANVKFTYEAGD